MTAKEARQQRLAAQLRANLRRRKAVPVDGHPDARHSGPAPARTEPGGDE